jgi:two-component system nitrate/nitrite sensor histidine kinase NarX
VGWIATTASNLAHQVEQQQSITRVHRLMLALAKNEDRLMVEVARELHDRGISALGIVRLMVEQERSRAIISAGLEQVIANLRELSDNQLSPLGLNRGLPQALDAMVETQRQLGLPVSLNITEDYADGESLSTLISRELFYIAQEAVVNALKHAAPSRVEISLARPDGQTQLRIWNDGRTFDVASVLVGRETHGMGIMQARANRIGGQLTISSDPDSGTEVTVRLDPASI